MCQFCSANPEKPCVECGKQVCIEKREMCIDCGGWICPECIDEKHGYICRACYQRAIDDYKKDRRCQTKS